MSAVPNPAPGAVGALAKLLQVYPELRALFAGNSVPVAGPTVRHVLTKYITAVEVKTTTGAVSRTTAWWTRYFCTSFIRMFGDLPVSAARSSRRASPASAGACSLPSPSCYFRTGGCLHGVGVRWLGWRRAYWS